MKIEVKKHVWIKWLLFFLLSIVVLISSILLYSRYIATKGCIIREYKITNSKIPDNFHGIKIVHISDIHYGRIIKEKELNTMVEKVNEIKPDIIVFTGDLVDQDTKLAKETTESITNILKKLTATMGKYTISGEDDSQFDSFIIMMENSGFQNLNDTYDTLYRKDSPYLLLSGVSSNSVGDKNIDEKLISTKEFLSTITEESAKPSYQILLVHEPDNITEIDIDSFDLILAGHSHNGQIIIPFIGPLFLPEHAKKYYNSYYTINQTELYISSGLGTSNNNFRLWNRPSFNFYRLTNH